jgi:hypothetical protein
MTLQLFEYFSFHQDNAGTTGSNVRSLDIFGGVDSKLRTGMHEPREDGFDGERQEEAGNGCVVEREYRSWYLRVILRRTSNLFDIRVTMKLL